MKTLSNVSLVGTLCVGKPVSLHCDEFGQENTLTTSIVQSIEETDYGYRVFTMNSVYDLSLRREYFEFVVSEKPVVMLGAPVIFMSEGTQYTTEEPVISCRASSDALILMTRSYVFTLKLR